MVARGSINIANNRLLHMPVVERFYVGGCPGCSGGNFFGVKNAGELYVNTGSEPIGSADCANRTGPGAGGTTTNQTRMVLFGSPLDISGDAYMCQTTLYLAGDLSDIFVSIHSGLVAKRFGPGARNRRRIVERDLWSRLENQ